jgi:predicted HNH restriction endonuclease
MKTDPKQPNWELILDAITKLKGCASTSQIKEYFIEHFLPEGRIKNIQYDSRMLAVNSPSRIHYSGGKQPRRTDSNNQYDKLFLNNEKKFELYCPKKHGIWEIVKDHLGTLSIQKITEPDLKLVESTIYPDETAQGVYLEGRTKQVTINAVERNTTARKECIDHYGAVCFVCNFDFSANYGNELGSGFIHVHHILDIALVGEEYVVDPIDDLRPLCPNCHAMVHRTKPAMHPNALKAIIDKIHNK